MNRVLITGGSGLLGLNWASAIRGQSEVFLGRHSRDVSLMGTVAVPIDIDSIESTFRCFDLLKPALVVHTAGLTSIEQCEADPLTARHKNVTIAQNVALACKRLKIKHLHISTDHLFDGSNPLVNEDATPCPRNVYAKTKAEAELSVLDANPDCLVVRTNFFGWGTSYRSSFSDIIIESLRAGKPIKLFEDIFFTPILIESLAFGAMQLLRTNYSGIFNLVGDTRISKFSFGVRLAREFGLDEKLISPVRFKTRSDLVNRPLDMSLSNQRATKLLGNQAAANLGNNIKRLRQQEKQGLAKEVLSI